jgi:hypothetical protein
MRRSSQTAMIPRSMHSSAQASFVFRLFSCLTILSLVAAGAHARQRPKPSDFAVIFGTVWGPDDRPVYGVTVKIRRAQDKKPRWEVHSNHLGEFEQFVPAGRETYILWAETKGFKTPDGRHLQAGQQVTIQIESNERVDTGVHLK